MKAFTIVFIVVATLFALATIGYVIFDIVNESKGKEKNAKEQTESSLPK